tara:strand:+ start:245 stop:469 length:225 start_codon:yes stop_codon:yes gene_type:complete
MPKGERRNNMKFEKHKNTRHATFNIRRNDIAKKAGINRLAITTMSSDWRIDDTTINMTLRDARALRDFLNKNLD